MPENAIQIAVASGKGGTGKTTVATSLAVHLASSCPVHYLDCDVEAPNGRFFLRPEIQRTVPVGRPVPRVDPKPCDECGKCSDVCRFNAIAVTRGKVLVFPELCHGCGGCAVICPQDAIAELPHSVGEVSHGAAGPVTFTEGALRAGETATVTLIREVRRHGAAAGISILDCPPGTSCPMVASVEGADLVLLVTEPTPFGWNDLGLAVKLVRRMGLQAGVVINRDGIGDDRVERFCDRNGLPILGRIPDDRSVAEAYSRGELPSESVPSFRAALELLISRVITETYQ